MIDLKDCMKTNKEKIKKSLENDVKLGALKFISDDVDYWHSLFSFAEERYYIKKFLLYRMAGALDLYDKDADDADITERALCELEKRLLSISCVAKVERAKDADKSEKKRAFLVYLKNDDSFYLETDTANSLLKDLGDFFRRILKKIEGKNWPEKTYIKDYKLNADAVNSYYLPFKFYYFYTLIDKIPKIIESEKFNAEDRAQIKKCLIILEERAKYTHSVQNMILVPYGYNSKRGSNLTTFKTKRKIDDRLDLTFVDFKEMLEEPQITEQELQERIHEKCSLKAVEFLTEHEKALFPPIPQFTTATTDFAAIIERAELVVETLKERNETNDTKI